MSVATAEIVEDPSLLDRAYPVNDIIKSSILENINYCTCIPLWIWVYDWILSVRTDIITTISMYKVQIGKIQTNTPDRQMTISWS